MSCALVPALPASRSIQLSLSFQFSFVFKRIAFGASVPLVHAMGNIPSAHILDRSVTPRSSIDPHAHGPSTIVVNSFTTSVTGPTRFDFNGKPYTATAAGDVVITNCPCTLTIDDRPHWSATDACSETGLRITTTGPPIPQRPAVTSTTIVVTSQVAPSQAPSQASTWPQSSAASTYTPSISTTVASTSPSATASANPDDQSIGNTASVSQSTTNPEAAPYNGGGRVAEISYLAVALGITFAVWNL